MPIIDLTARQRRALRALDWLYDTTDGTRRSGRSTVLALSCLRRLVFHPPRTLTQSDWLDVNDHVSMRQTDRMLVDTILRLAERLGLPDGIETDSRGQIRLRPGVRIPDRFRDAITEFGDMSEDELPPPPMPLQRSVMNASPSRSAPAKTAPQKPPAPAMTLWDHLTSD